MKTPSMKSLFVFECPVTEAGAFGAQATGGDVRNVQLTDQELDAIIDVLENSKVKNVRGIDIEALEKKLYMTKVKKESPMGGGGAQDGESGAPEESEVEGTY